jgi:hypothetical protein
MRPVDRARLRARHWKQRPDNVIPLRPRLDDGIQSTRAFDTLTARIVMQRHAAGTLDPAIVAALLNAVGLAP